MLKTMSIGFMLLVLGIASAGWPSPAVAAEPKAENASRWEYRVVTKEQLLDLGKKDLAAGLNKLGDEGWELTAVDGAYIFKRPNQSLTLEDVKRRVAAAETALEAWKERVSWSERMVKKGFMTDTQLQRETARLEAAERVLEQARTELKAFPPEPKLDK